MLSCGTTKTVVDPEVEPPKKQEEEELKTPARNTTGIGNEQNMSTTGSPTSVMGMATIDISENPIPTTTEAPVEEKKELPKKKKSSSAFSSFFCLSLNDKYTPEDVTTATPAPEPVETLEEKERREQATAEIVRKMMEGWTIMETPCPTCGIPLMSHHQIESTAECPLCGPPPPVPVPEEAPAPVVPVVISGNQVLLSVKEEADDVQSRREKASAEIGNRLLSGWTLVEETKCGECSLPVLQKDGIEECVICGQAKKLTEEEKAKATIEIGKRVLDGWKLTNCPCKTCELPLMRNLSGEDECVKCGKSVQITLDMPSDFDFRDQKALEGLLLQLQRKQKTANVVQGKDNASASKDATAPVQPQQERNPTVSTVDTSLELDESYPGAAEKLREGWTALNNASCDCGCPLMRRNGCRTVYCVNMLCPLSIYQNAIPQVDEEEFAPVSKSRTRSRGSKGVNAPSSSTRGGVKSYTHNVRNKPLLSNPIMEEEDFDIRDCYERNNSKISEFPIGYIATDNNPGMEEASQLSGDTFTRTVTSEAVGAMLTRMDNAKEQLLNPTGKTHAERLRHQKEMAELIQSLASAAERIKSLDSKK
uniref:Uncharacterized protein n=1 Tax=Leptocylindrus danicus TaxID=163516 RepID=A0A7S2KKL1_9STRA|mmetsp:Transcript_23743/g.35650  ORF Transcript_23743/g.35650 Transcript_23743/m.35650 type:complete len:593 (+) Transcript_23743:115-1893(+)